MLTPEQYQTIYYNKLFKKPPRFKVGDKVTIKTARGPAPATIVEVVFMNTRSYKVYVEDTFGYVWWDEKDISKV